MLFRSVTPTMPTVAPTMPTVAAPTMPTVAPTMATMKPTVNPSMRPTVYSSMSPTTDPSMSPTVNPSMSPSVIKTNKPTKKLVYTPPNINIEEVNLVLSIILPILGFSAVLGGLYVFMGIGPTWYFQVARSVVSRAGAGC